MLVDSVFKRDLIVTGAVSPFFFFPKLPGPGSLMAPFSTFLVCFLLLLLIFYFYRFLSRPYIFVLSFFILKAELSFPSAGKFTIPRLFA